MTEKQAIQQLAIQMGELLSIVQESTHINKIRATNVDQKLRRVYSDMAEASPFVKVIQDYEIVIAINAVFEKHKLSPMSYEAPLAKELVKVVRQFSSFTEKL